ncbi:MAG: division plane positioning ATPase MipZ [Acidimicrobiales bacterium]
MTAPRTGRRSTPPPPTSTAGPPDPLLDTEIAGIGDRVQAIEDAAAFELPSLGVTGSDPSAVVTERDRDRTLAQLRNELGLAETERSARWQLYAEAVAVLDDLEQAGPPQAMFITQDIIEPLEISAGEFDRRLAEGRRGFNNFAVGEVPPPIGTIGPAGPATALPVRTTMGAIAGALLAAALVVVQTRFDRRMRTAADVERCFGVPVLAEIPVTRGRPRGQRTPMLHAADDTRSVVTESYRRARSAALHQLGAGPGETPTDSGEARVIVVTSPGHGDGRTITAANLATLFAESGLAVLVLDCDHRSPDLHTYFGRRYEARRALDSGVRGLTLVADAAEPTASNPSAVVEAQRDLVTRARSRYDLIVVDAAPLLATDDATALLPIADQVLLVVRSGWTERSAAAASADLLYRRGAPVAGVIVTASADAGREPRRRSRKATQVVGSNRRTRGGGFARLMGDRRSRGTA